MPRSRSTIVLGSAALIIGAIVGLAYLTRLYEVDGNGISPFIGKPPTLDFTNLWYGGRLALRGETDVLFNVAEYRAGLQQMFAPYVQPSEWSYPPSVLLIGAPLALLPLYPAYLVWTVGTLGALSLVLYRAGLPILACLLLWISPAALNNIFFGQNGAATAALLIGGLLAAERKPWLAGLCFGLLTMKPHLGLLVPICLVAAGYWRAIGWSLFFSALFVLASAALFGPAVWRGFFEVTQPLMRSILEAPYGNGYQMNAATFFLTARWAGADLAGAYLFQGLITLFAAVAAWKLWRNTSVDPLLRIAATAMLAPLATPYAYSYDMVMVAAAILIIVFRSDWPGRLLLIPAWLLPGVLAPMNREFAPVGPLILGASAALALFIAWRSAGIRQDRGNRQDVGERCLPEAVAAGSAPS